MNVKKSLYKFVGLIVMLAMLLAASPLSQVAAAAVDVGPALQAGADRLTALQNTDGGWDWPLDNSDPATGSAANTIGPIAMGLAEAYGVTGDSAHEAALLQAGAFLLTKTNNFSPSDGYLAAALDEIFGGTAYVDHVVANFYNPLAAGTYDRNGGGTLYDTAGYVNMIRTARSGIYANMAVWDIGIGLVGAASCGADTTAWIDGVKAEIDELDSENYYDVLGLAGAVYGLAFVGEDFDPTAGSHAAASSLADLADILASYQINLGGFAWNAGYVIADDGNEAIQETAYAILALNEVDREAYLSNIVGAADYMMSVQLGTGGWENYVGSSSGENNEITGEALWGINVAYPQLWVCPTGDCGHPGAQYSTIQDAVANIGAGGRIYVAAGTYEEIGQIVIDKDLSIIGADKDTTIIKPTDNTGSSGDTRGWFLVPAGVEFNLSNVTLDGSGFNIYQGIRSMGTGTIDNNNIINISYPGYMGVGIAVMDANVVISNNSFENMGRIGTILFGSGVTNGLFDSNVYVGKGEGDWLDYGIELGGGAVATITNNTISNCLGVASSDGSTSGAVIVTTYYGAGTAATIEDNLFTGNSAAILVGYDEFDTSTVTAEFNQIVGNDTGVSTTAPFVDASPNWWGSIAGPDSAQIEGTVEYSPWCGDAECTFLVDAVAGTDLQASIDALGGSGTLYVPAGTYGQTGAYTLGGVTLILADGTVIQNSSPCFTVTASHTKITTESIGGAVCVPTSGSSGIVVDGGLQDITIEGLEIKGDEVTGGLHGIEFVGGVDYVTIVNNYIHDLTGSAISFGGLVTNNLGIQGNLFMGLDVTYPGPDVLDASYNSWGGYDPAPTMANVDTLPFTYVGLEAASSGALSVDQVAQGGTVTYTVTAKITEVAGMDFVLTYPTALLTSPVISNVTTAFTGIPLTSDPATYGDLVSVDEGAGRIRFNGVAAGYEPVTTLPDGGILFTVTFTATDALTVGTLEFVDDVFSMIPSSTPYAPSNNIYASLLTDGVVSVVELPTITAIGYDGVFVAGVPEEFYLDIDNPADGGTFANPWLQFNLAGSGATLEYFNGVDWVDASGGLDLSAMAPGDFMDDFLFRITFPTRGSYAITATLVDGDAGDAFLASVELGASVAGNFDVYGTFTMQGRTTRSGITVNLTMADPALYGPYSGVTEDFVPNNLFIAGVTEATYTVTTVQPRYLNVTADLGIEITVSGEAYFMNLLQLMGGNADWSDNEITLSDASIVGSMYGIGGIEDDADVNFDGRVNIQDLALVGGNYTLTSADVYGTWLP